MGDVRIVNRSCQAHSGKNRKEDRLLAVGAIASALDLAPGETLSFPLMSEPAVRLAHIVNPVAVGEKSDLFTAQPITFQTMIEAKRFAAPGVQVELFTAQYAEDRGLAPDDFHPTPDLTRSIMDCGQFSATRKLPLIKDILDRLYEATTADYLIYTNVDIGLQPYFYQAVAGLIAEGMDAICINRRVVPARYRSPQDILSVWSEVGKPHAGFDCFVFDRTHYPKFRLGNVCIGTGGIGRALLDNLRCHGRRFALFKDKHLTFHIGEDMPWRGGIYEDMLQYNCRERVRVLQQLRSEFSEFDRLLTEQSKRYKPSLGRFARQLISTANRLWRRR